MRATLLKNPDAGTSDDSTSELVAALQRAGFAQVSTPALDKDRLPELLAGDVGDLVVAAGGDGTVAAVARALRRRGVPLAILPRGTANNVARTFEVPTELEAWTRGLARPRRVPLDIGCAKGSWGERTFVESAGVGLFHYVMTEQASDDDKEPQQALKLIRKALDAYQPREWSVTLDGRDHSGAYLLVEAMNIRSLGPGLVIAPRAEPGDGRFDVVLVPATAREALATYLDRLCAGDADATLEVPVVRAARVAIELAGKNFRVDDKARPTPEQPAADRVELTLDPQAVTLWVPGAA